MNAAAPARFANLTLPQQSTLGGARFVTALLALRWLAGIVENLGIPSVSQAAALIMMIGIGMQFLGRMRLAAGSMLCVAGLLAWMFTGALSFAANPMANPTIAASLLLLLGLYALFANAAATYLRDQASLVLIQGFVAAFIVIGAALAIIQVTSGTGFVEAGKAGIIRAYVSDVHPVSFAIQMVAALVTLEIVRVKRGLPLTAAHLVLIILAITSIYLTFARTAWVMAALIVAFVMIQRGNGLQRALTFGAVAGVILVVSLTSDRFADLGSLPFFLTNFTFGDVVFDYRYIDNSVSWRIVNWSYGISQALEQPVFGFGPGQSATSSYFSLEMHNILLEVFLRVVFWG
jgi:O-antigen ligase